MLNPAITIKPFEFYWSGLGVTPGTPADYRLARTFYQKELRDARSVDDRGGMIRALCGLGYVSLALRQFKEADGYAGESLKLAEALSDYVSTGYADNLLGDIAYAQAKMEDANLFYRRGWAAYARVGEKKGEAWSYTHIGNAARGLGDLDAALEMYGKSAGLIETMEEPSALVWNKNWMAMANGWTGRYREAFDIYREVFDLYRSRHDIRGQAWTLELLGNLKLAGGEDEEAEKIFRQARALFPDQGGDPQGAGWHHYHIGTVYLFRKNYEDAKDEFHKALTFFKPSNDALGQAAAFANLGEIACLQRKHPEAQENLKQGMELVLTGPGKELLPDLLTGLAQWFKNQGEDKKAFSLFIIALSHPACCHQTKDKLISLAAELEPGFTYDPDDKRLLWVKDTDLGEVAKSWLVSLGKKTSWKEKENPISKRKKTKKVSSKAREKK